MDRRSLLALFNAYRRPAAQMAAAAQEPPADAVYETARVIRGRIDAALAASRTETPPAATR